MPKDKKSKEGKKKEGPSQEVEVVVKRKNSIVDSSGGSSSSSSASSDNSGSSSEHGSLAGDSDSFLSGFDEKGTMTNDSQEGTSSSVACTSSSVTMQPSYSIDIVDRTEELHFLINGGQNGRNVKIVNDQNSIPISDSTHFTPITPSDVPTTSAAHQQPNTNGNKQNGKPAIKGGCKQKQLTKKQRKEQERREKEISGAPITYPGQREPLKKAPIHYMHNVEKKIEMHHFDESTREGCTDGEIVVRGTNAAAQAMMNTTETVAVPYIRDEDQLGSEMKFVDLHKNAQMRYLRYTNGIKNYTNMDTKVKPLHRMGFGIAASGIPDKVPLTLTMSGAKHFMKPLYSDYVAEGFKINNWHAEFASQCDMDRINKPEEYIEWQAKLSSYLDDIIHKTKDDWRQKTLCTIRDMDLRQVLLRFGEIERYFARNEAKCENRFAELNKVTFAERDRHDRMGFIVSEMLSWSSQAFTEKFDGIVVEKRAYSILMHLASTSADEKPCYEDRHRKCAILHYFLSQCSEEHRAHWLRQKFMGGNTILHFAAMTGSPCQIDVLLRMGAPLNELNDMFKSPVALAIRRHQSLTARQLMWHGADIGGSLSLKHITPRTHREFTNKENSDYEDGVAGAIPYKAREFVIARLKALSMTFCSWLQSILLDAELRFKLGVGNLKSGLHQIRIGPDPFDKEIRIGKKLYKQKTIRMTIENSETVEPTVLFLIPCQYTSFDTTMPASCPHIVRTPMLTDALAVAQRIAEKEAKRVAAGENRVSYTEDISACRPVKVLARPISISYGDSCTDRVDVLESFFSFEHNGVLYGYTIPKSISHSGTASTNITVTLTIPEDECERFKGQFFMLQAVQVVKLEPPVPLPEADPSPVKCNVIQQQQDDIWARVTARKLEIQSVDDSIKQLVEEMHKSKNANPEVSTGEAGPSTSSAPSTSGSVPSSSATKGASKKKSKTE